MTDFSVINLELDADIRYFDEIFPCFKNSRFRQYYDDSTINSAFPKNSVADLSILHVNTHPRNVEGDKLFSYLFILSRHFEIICLAETLYREKTTEIFFEQYIGFYSNKLSSLGGGFCILFR